ncbi:uncharacterized protein LOC116268421 [Nymphaea colorata]|uniref:uncharacterized protein LOC116268421 n=1 Tax=Nymphaea colorata TaxID=210225 RepID=UPI00129ED0EF|nr:uncharacterized protein LOC116268421 [Nymphaea colorata]
MCVPSCPVPSFAFIEKRICIDICPITIANSPGYFGDPGTTPTRLCVTTCITSGLYRDVANNRTCQPTCTYNSSYKTYREPNTMTCTANCPTYPQYLYAWASNSTNSICISPCTTGYMNDANMSCVAACPFLVDPTTNRCVSSCPISSAANTTLYANLVAKKCVSASSCPNGTYASDDSLTCVSECPNNTYIFGKNCVKFCPNGYYINLVSQTCVLPSACPANYFANNQTTSCVLSCTNGTFGDSTTRQCITACYGSNYADPYTGLCSSSCSTGLLKNSLTLSCVSNCTTGYFYNPLNLSCTTTCQSPYYADTKSLSCVLVCSSNPMTFASITPVRACVTTCPSNASWFDLVNRVCVATCPASTYQYSVNSSCVSFCPPPYFLLASVCVLNCTFNGTTNMYADSTTQTCVSSCPAGYYTDPTTYKCVVNCPINPVRYYADSSKKCLTVCGSNKYADNEKGACVSTCSVLL